MKSIVQSMKSMEKIQKVNRVTLNDHWKKWGTYQSDNFLEETVKIPHTLRIDFHQSSKKWRDYLFQSTINSISLVQWNYLHRSYSLFRHFKNLIKSQPMVTISNLMELPRILSFGLKSFYCHTLKLYFVDRSKDFSRLKSSNNFTNLRRWSWSRY